MLGSAAAILVAMALAPPLLESSAARAGVLDALTLSGGVSVQQRNVADAGQFDAFQRRAQQKADPVLGGVLLGPAEIARLEPVTAASVNDAAPKGATTGTLAVAYASDLSRHVDVVQGELPEAVQETSAEAASMPEDRADRLGLHLSDVVCLAGPPPTTSDGGLWCARLVGLWRTVDRNDPYWQSVNPRPDLFTSRDGFFALLARQKAAAARAQRWFWPSATTASPAGAATINQTVGRLRQSVGRSAGVEVQTSLDQQLSGYDAVRGVAGFIIELMTAAVLVLAVLLIALLSRHLLNLQGRELGLLKVRGWPSTAFQRVLAIELTAIAGSGAAAGLLAAWVGLTVFRPSHPLWALTGLDLTDLAWAGVALLVALQGAVIVMAVAANHANRQPAPLTSPPETPVDGSDQGWRVAMPGLLALSAAPLLLLPRLLGAEPPSGLQQLAGTFGYLVDVGALALLAVAAVHLVSPASTGLAGRYQGVEGTLARWQLRGWWRRHSAFGFMLVFGTAISTAAAAEIAHLLLADGTSPALLGPGAFRSGLLIGLATVLAGATALIVIAFYAELDFAGRARRSDYVALMADGLAARSIRRSLALEHNHVLLIGVPVGSLLGLALLWATGPSAGVDSDLPRTVAGLSALASGVGVLIAGAPIFVGGFVAGRLVRARVRLLGGGSSLDLS